MEKSFQENLKNECVCGESHTLSTQKIVVSLNAFSDLINNLVESKYKNILIMSSLKDPYFVDELKVQLTKTDKQFSVISMPNCLANNFFAQKIEDKNQDVVVAMGNDQIISLAKYYAYSFECPLILFASGNFCDFTFSKYARLFDGVMFQFYVTNPPEEIYVSLKLNGYNEYQLQYIASKFFAMFDNKIKSVVYKKDDCPKMQEFLKKTLVNHMKNIDLPKEKLNEINIWTLIRLGQAMSYFNSSKNFFGADRAISEMLCGTRIGADYLEMNTISFKLLMNSYDCFLKKRPYNFSVNLNRHIQGVSKFLKISSTTVLQRLVDSELLQIDKKKMKVFESYQPYLYAYFKKLAKHMIKVQTKLYLNENVLKKYNIKANLVEKAFALAVNFSEKHSLLHIIYGYGYLDRLLCE